MKLKMLALTVLITATPAFAYPGGKQGKKGKGGGMNGPHPEVLIEELGIEGDQAAKIRQVHAESRSKIQAMRPQMHEKKQALHAAIASDKSKEELLKMFDDVSELKKEKQRIRFQTMLDIRELLTPEQRKKFSISMEEERQKRHERKWKKRMKKGQQERSSDED